METDLAFAIALTRFDIGLAGRKAMKEYFFFLASAVLITRNCLTVFNSSCKHYFQFLFTFV